jgi:hypothetical protein
LGFAALTPTYPKPAELVGAQGRNRTGTVLPSAGFRLGILAPGSWFTPPANNMLGQARRDDDNCFQRFNFDFSKTTHPERDGAFCICVAPRKNAAEVLDSFRECD